MSELANKVILITGASSGIGAALARILAQQVPSVKLVLAARNNSKLTEVAANCRDNGAEVLVVPTDLAQTESVQNLAQQTIERFGTVDILVNNAGYGQMGPVELIPPEAAKKQFAVNFHGALTLTQALVPVMRKQGAGKIVNISSLGGRIPFPIAGMYSCSKFALEALSDVLRMELKTFGIRVVVIEPGPVVTDFFRAAWEEVLQTIPHYKETDYAPVFENIEQIDSQLDILGWTAEKTARRIVAILQKKRPKARYVLATGGSILIFLMNKVLPITVRDAFWKRIYGVHKINSQD